MERNNAGGVSVQQRSSDRTPSSSSSSSRSGILAFIWQSWAAFVLGSVGLFIGIVLTAWNEVRAVKTSKALEESISMVTEVLPNAPIDKDAVGKLIYLSGKLVVQEPLTEAEYGIAVSAVKLKRRVQMYQWVEEETMSSNENGDLTHTSYNYYTEWKDRIIDSSSFQLSVARKNPAEFPIKSQTQINEYVQVGDYILGLELKKKFSDYIEITSDERPERRDIKLHSGLYYHSQDIWNPSVGDLRIQFSYAGQHGQMVSIVGQLDSSNTIVPFKTKHGVDILILKMGMKTVAEVFISEQKDNVILTWLYRMFAWFILYMGSVCIATILGYVVERSRLLRDLLPTTHSSLKMTASICIFLLVTALAWIWYRPVLGVGLVIATIFLLFMTKNISSRGEYNRL